jgi:hypothetical protein
MTSSKGNRSPSSPSISAAEEVVRFTVVDKDFSKTVLLYPGIPTSELKDVLTCIFSYIEGTFEQIWREFSGNIQT